MERYTGTYSLPCATLLRFIEIELIESVRLKIYREREYDLSSDLYTN